MAAAARSHGKSNSLSSVERQEHAVFSRLDPRHALHGGQEVRLPRTGSRWPTSDCSSHASPHSRARRTRAVPCETRLAADPRESRRELGAKTARSRLRRANTRSIRPLSPFSPLPANVPSFEPLVQANREKNDASVNASKSALLLPSLLCAAQTGAQQAPAAPAATATPVLTQTSRRNRRQGSFARDGRLPARRCVGGRIDTTRTHSCTCSKARW